MNNSSGSGEASCNITYKEVAVPLATVYSLVLIFGLPANLLTLCLSTLKIRRKNVLSVYLFTLSLSDLIYLGTIPQWISYVRNSNQWSQSFVSCQLTGYIFFNNLYISILLLCCISVDRCLVVLYPIEAQWRRQRRTAVAVCATIWMLVMVTHTPVFVLSGVRATQSKNNSCFETIPMPPLVAMFNYARFFVGFCIPLLILASTNFLIFRRIQSSPCLNQAQKAKVKYLALAVILIFLGCFAPYHIILLSRAVAYSLLENSCWFEQKIYTVSTVFLCLSTINSAINPFLYMFSSESVRQELIRDLRILFCLPIPQDTGTESCILRNGPSRRMSSSQRE
ncbi:probable G-protein coupled receptor 132 [Pristis pectinata]|uniref:probable G-protein coupled receptor 132 n=1 Tax=Pristis pectinata TaxID=685728 RepID=UPI00223E8E87|nr:probable G-protein coupled receptor 132 [Pristis pectinata]XP_051888057.1 probable G-protein coupled receptor 132 [Pristis pectinata]XP_051888138.1 probable G-protein coupled receptor 132 [Pristis pectinata]